jgi:hypothetical protein
MIFTCPPDKGVLPKPVQSTGFAFTRKRNDAPQARECSARKGEDAENQTETHNDTHHLLWCSAICKGKYTIRTLDREEEKSYHGMNLWFIQREISWAMIH